MSEENVYYKIEVYANSDGSLMNMYPAAVKSNIASGKLTDDDFRTERKMFGSTPQDAFNKAYKEYELLTSERDKKQCSNIK